MKPRRNETSRHHVGQLPLSNPPRAEHLYREQDTTNMMNNDAPVNLLDRPELPELSLNGAELSVNGSSPHIDDQPPEPPADRDGYRMKHYYVEVVFETGEWTDGWACGRCEDAELICGEIALSLGVEAHTDEEALSKAVTAARTAIHNAGTAAVRFEPAQLKLLAGDKHQRRQQLLHDRKPPLPKTLLTPAELERYRTDERYRHETRWSSSDVNGAECWAVAVASGQNTLPPEEYDAVLRGCWVSASGSGS
jgi:hypothetical protein